MVHLSGVWDLCLTIFSPTLWRFSNLWPLVLHSEIQTGFKSDWAELTKTFIRGCIVHLPRLRHLQLDIPEFQNSSRLIHHINVATGLQGKSIGHASHHFEYWYWMEPCTKTIVWTDHMYARSVLWDSIVPKPYQSPLSRLLENL